ncbi:MAG: hypothetical protein H8D65_02490 [Spirochaetes bacterium]|nr:hypothetical protein [Spirochaetota bacterium]MBL7007169.1 hypothetical protein [Spirochaetia bacterium]
MDVSVLRKRVGVWFVIHFVVDFCTAVPLFVIPVVFLRLLGWNEIDPVAARLVAAALFGIGIESFLGRKSSLNSFITMLNLKIIWSATAVVGLGINLIERAQGNPLAVWAVFIIFLGFHAVWVYLRVQAGRVK